MLPPVVDGTRSPHPRRPGLDPSALLAAVLHEAGARALFGRLPAGLGRTIYNRILGALRRDRRVKNSESVAEGVYQDFLFRIIRRFQRLGHEGIEGVGWFHTVARSALMDRFGDLAAAAPVCDLEDLLEGEQPIAEAAVDWALARDLVVRCMAALPPRQRQLLELDQAGLSTGKVASTLGLTPRSVVTMRCRAARALRDRILEARRRLG